MANRGAPRSRAIRATAAARLPPALSPTTASLRRIAAELTRVLCRPQRHGVAVVDGSRIARFGRPAVIDRDDDGGRRVAQRPADPVVGVQVAQHEAAAVKENHRRDGLIRRSRRPIDPDRDLSGGARHGAVDDLAHRLRIRAAPASSSRQRPATRARISVPDIDGSSGGNVFSIASIRTRAVGSIGMATNPRYSAGRRSTKLRRPSWPSAVCMFRSCAIASSSKEAAREPSSDRLTSHLVSASARVGPAASRADERRRLGDQLLGRHDPSDQPDRIRPLGADIVTEHQELFRPMDPDQTR